jgi:hypothetical protein
MTNINQWVRGRAVIVALRRPAGDAYPIISARRVRGAQYSPYKRGSIEWRAAANAALARIAAENLRQKGF